MAARTTLDEVSAAGAFVRTASTLTSAPGLSAEWPAEAGRYVLYVARACPWASRVLATLALRGLDHAIAVTNVAPVWQHTKPGVDGHRGWVFRARAAKGSADESLAYVPLADPLTGAETLRGVYEAVAPPETPKFTVPLLVCARTRKAVCNESAVLTRAFDAPAWDAIARFPAVRLAPAALLPDIDAANDAMYETINNGVYKCGFAVSQAAYDAAAAAAAAAFDSFAARLERAPFLVGGRLTESDIRLYLTLIRWVRRPPPLCTPPTAGGGVRRRVSSDRRVAALCRVDSRARATRRWRAPLTPPPPLSLPPARFRTPSTSATLRRASAPCARRPR